MPTFLLLAYIFRNEDKEYDRGNLVATTSMASLFLLVGVTAITAHTDPSRDTWTGDSIEHSKEFAERSVIATYIFLALWATCISKVILIIRKYVSFRILEPINSPTHETDPQQAD